MECVCVCSWGGVGNDDYEKEVSQIMRGQTCVQRGAKSGQQWHFTRVTERNAHNDPWKCSVTLFGPK